MNVVIQIAGGEFLPCHKITRKEENEKFRDRKTERQEDRETERQKDRQGTYIKG